MRGLITSIITAIAITSLQAQSSAVKPKLVVGVTIDQLNTELIEAYWDLYGNDGFKKLWREGLVYKHTNFPLNNIDRSSAIATINTGAVPNKHGIIANEWVDKSTRQVESCVYDRDYMGNYTSFSSSPRKLLASTLTDELNRETQGDAIVYSIAPYPDMAILLAGHSANGVLWFNPENGKWSSSTFYREYPHWLGNYNEQNSVVFRENEMVWIPSLPLEKYHQTTRANKTAFRYNLTSPFDDRYRKVVESPIINNEIVALVNQLLKETNIGEDHITDYLQIGLYAGNNIIPNTLSSIESQDIYARLDQNIAQLIKVIDQKVGLHNTLFYVTSTGYRKEVDEESAYNIPTGEFHLNRASALLNLYLMAKYGEGQFIETYGDLHIHFDHELLENKGISLSLIQKDATEFLLQLSGVLDVYSSTDLYTGSNHGQAEKVINSYYKGRSGDIIINLLPGWKSINNNNKVEKIVSYATVQSPTIFLAPSFESKVINTPLQAEAIAPTVAKTIQIRAPNAAQESPIK